ncbi:MAG: hypothetical protein COA85_01380 [Robiginitomaculum sp.]|nr:MAG: hypothetical protein COA85_01380 [Robiginitomaculum sp.]
MNTLGTMKRNIASFSVVAVLFLLTSCAATPLMDDGEARVTESAYGDYLAARFASGMNDVHAAAHYYGAALEKQPDNDLLRKQAFLSALLAGRIADSANFARAALGTDSEANLMRLAMATNALGKKRYETALGTLAEGKYGPFNGEVRQLLRGWAAYGTGDADKALEYIKSAGEAPIFARIVHLQLALLLDLEDRADEAEGAYKIATEPGQISDRAVYAYGSFLERHDRADEARAEYEKASNTFTQAPMSALASSQLSDDKKTKSPRRLVRNASEGAAEALYGTSQILAAQAHFDKALVYLEMARFINPDHGAALQLLARVMEVEKRPEDALKVFASISQKSPYRLNADLSRARVLFRTDHRDEAMEVFRSLAGEHPGDDRLAVAYADALRSVNKYKEALPIYERLIASQGKNAGWQLYFARGTALERLGRGHESITDFRKALKINPEQPDVLNYLGYTYINAGENLDEGFALIEQALSLRPNAGYIIDSLGWAHYRLGQYEQAVRYLERAVEMEPGEPTISDHLADAYWQAGRHLEARFQWSHTLSLKPDDDVDFEVIRGKLENGLRDAPEIANATP